MPAAVELRIKYDYDARFNANDRLYIRDELIAKSDRADALLITQQDQMYTILISRLRESRYAPSNRVVSASSAIPARNVWCGDI
jgi:hypothetical protein